MTVGLVDSQRIHPAVRQKRHGAFPATRGVLIEGIPDNRTVRVAVDDDGNLNYVFPNRLILPQALKRRLSKEALKVHMPAAKPMRIPQPEWVVNACCDPDEYHTALISMDKKFGTSTPIFNHPRAIAKTRRDLTALALEGINGLTVPKCVRFLAEDLEVFREVFAREGFAYPVLIRPARSQSGKGLLKISKEADWDLVAKSHWYGIHHYMSQFTDYAQPDGSYQKIRLRFVNGVPKIRAYRDSPDWMITGTVQRMDDDFRNRALATAQRLQADETFMEIGQEIGRRIKLNFFGADIGVMPDGGFVLFEANAAMTIASSRHAELRADPLMRKIYAELEEDLTSLFDAPAKWRRGEEFLPPVLKILGEPATP